jgi:Co/Zn/Cd efflux system component
MSNINLEKRQKYALLISASLNFILFSAELTVGLIIMSMNLVADSTDMFIDTITYLVAI